MRRLRTLTASLLLGVLLAVPLLGIGPRPARAADDLAGKEEALRKAEETLKKLRGELLQAQREQEDAERAAQEVLRKLLQPDEYAKLKEAWARVLQLAGVGMTLYSMGPVLALPFLVKMFAVNAALEELRVTTEDIQEMQAARQTVGDKKIDMLAAEKKAAESRLAREQAGVCVAQNDWAARTMASLGGGGGPSAGATGPAAKPLEVIPPKDQYVQVDTDVDFSVVVRGGTPPYHLHVTSQAFEAFDATIDADGGRLDRKLRFRPEGVYSVLVGVEDDAISGKQTRSATVVYNVRTDPVPPPGDTGGGPITLVLPKGGDVEVGKDVDLSIVVRGGRPPYRLRVASPEGDPIEGPLEASGDTFQRTLRFPQAGTYRVEVSAADEGRPSPGTASGTVVFTAKAGPVPPPGAAPGTLDLVLPTGVLPATAGKAVKLPIRVSGGLPPYVVEVRSNVPHDVRQTVGTADAGAAGATFEPDLVFPQAGTYTVDVRVDDDAPARQRQTRSGSVQFRVEAAEASTTPPVATLTVDPPSVTLRVGESQRFEAIATTKDAGQAKVSDLVRWTGGPVFQAARPGTFKVTAEMAGQVASADVTVQEAAAATPAFSLRIEPETLTLEVGQSKRLEAVQVFPERPGDTPYVSDEATWDGVDSGRTFRADREGSYLVTATYKGVKARATITVTAPAVVPRPPLTARLECGGLLELRPGQVSRSCGVIVEGWRSDTAERVEVEVGGLGGGVEAFPGTTWTAPGNMYNPGVADDKTRYVFGEGWSARAGSPPGSTQATITVRQRGVGEVSLPLTLVVLSPGGGPSGPAGPGGPPVSSGQSGALGAELECGDSFELAPGDVGRSCGVVVRGWRSDTVEPVEVEVVWARESSGVEVFPGSTQNAPGNMYNPGVADNKDRYVFGEGFRAREDAPPGVTSVTITVRQQGAGEVRLSLNVAVLKKGLLPSSGAGIRPPAQVAQGSGGEYCVWRYKLFGDPPACFHFAAAACTSPRYTNAANGYELVGAGMTFGEADTRMRQLGSYFDDNYGCRQTAQTPPPPAPSGGPTPPPGEPPQETPPVPPPPPVDQPPAPTGPVLARFGVFCEPRTIHVGESSGCRAIGEYSDRPGVYVDLTGKASWTGGPEVAGQQEGSVQVSASLEDASDSATVTVEARAASTGTGPGSYDPRNDPNVPGGGTGMTGGSGVPGGGDGLPGAQPPGDHGLGGGPITAQGPGYGQGGGPGTGEGGAPGSTPGAPGSGVPAPGTPGAWPWPAGVTGVLGVPMCWNAQTQRAEPCPQARPGSTPPRWAGVVPPGRTPRTGPGGGTGPTTPPTGGGTTPPSPPTPTPPPVTSPPPTPTTPPITTPPTPPPVTQGGECDQPLCREMCVANCMSMSGVDQWCTNGCAAAPPCGRSDYKLAEVKTACYLNILARCRQGESGRTGGWCVGKGSQPSCEAKAMSVCGCDPKTHPACGGKWDSRADGPPARLAGATLPPFSSRWSCGAPSGAWFETWVRDVFRLLARPADLAAALMASTWRSGLSLTAPPGARGAR